jgi:hypothetical protein
MTTPCRCKPRQAKCDPPGKDTGRSQARSVRLTCAHVFTAVEVVILIWGTLTYTVPAGEPVRSRVICNLRLATYVGLFIIVGHHLWHWESAQTASFWTSKCRTHGAQQGKS